MAAKSGAAEASKENSHPNPWGSSLDKFTEWDPKGAETLLRVGTNPWTSGVLPRKEVELISLALNCACTNLDEAGTRRHIRGAPILLEEAKAAGVEPRSNKEVPTPVCDKAREIGQWNTAWDPFFNLDP